MTPTFRFAAAALACVGLAACAPPTSFSAPAEAASCEACGDFFTYANRGWMDSTRIPEGRSGWSNFGELAARNDSLLVRVMKDAARDTAIEAHPERRMIGVYFGTCLDTARMEQLGIDPLRPQLEIVGGIRTRDGVADAIARLDAINYAVPPFSLRVGQDPRNSDSMLVSLAPAAPGLGDHEPYLRDDARSVAVRAAYVQHVSRVLELLGAPAERAGAGAAGVLRLETRLARAALPRERASDPGATYHPMPLAQVQRITPGYDWARHLAGQGAAGKARRVNVREPRWLSAFDSALVQAPLEDWRAYLRWRVANGLNDVMAGPLGSEFERYAAEQQGRRGRLQRELLCAGNTRGALDMPVSKLFVQAAFGPEARERARRMVEGMRTVMREEMAGAAWMSPPTRARALAKLDAMEVRIGYPEEWPEVEPIDFLPGAHAENLMRLRRHLRTREWRSLGRPVNRADWVMSPTRVNAQSVWTRNQLIFPAGILQPPFYDPQGGDLAADYGAIGSIIGHEMVHGFDNTGRQYDETGSLRDWWLPHDAARFDSLASLIVKQFDEYTVLDGAARVNGRLTLSENLSDLGGVRVAYRAMRRALEAGEVPPVVEGLTADQRFFLAYARAFRQVARPEALHGLVVEGPHSPMQWRVNGPLSNMPEFRAAWGCRAGDAMVRPDSVRVQVW